jgi:hypothetical protein
MKYFHLLLSLLALALVVVIGSQSAVAAIVLWNAFACLLNSQSVRLCTVTLSVPEILSEILEAFKLETPELFGPAGFSQDFSSDTAALGDRITAHISHVPVTGAYDANNGGFKNASQDVTTLIEDVPVTLNQLRHVPVKVGYLTNLATKGLDLYKAACANIAFSLGKYVVDQILSTAASGYVSNQITLLPAFAGLDSLDGDLRNACNAAKMSQGNRFCFVNSTLAKAIGTDDRMRSKLFFNQRNAGEGFRVWNNVGGFEFVREYPDFPINAAGLAGDKRLAVVSVRKIKNMATLARDLRVPVLMEFSNARDEASGLELTGITWQESGTGDTYFSVAILFGVGVGNQGGAAGTVTDNAGLLIKTQ